MKKRIEPKIMDNNKEERKKISHHTELQSGHFVGCQYIKKSESRDNFMYHKKGVNEAHEKYQSGKGV